MNRKGRYLLRSPSSANLPVFCSENNAKAFLLVGVLCGRNSNDERVVHLVLRAKLLEVFGRLRDFHPFHVRLGAKLFNGFPCSNYCHRHGEMQRLLLSCICTCGEFPSSKGPKSFRLTKTERTVTEAKSECQNFLGNRPPNNSSKRRRFSWQPRSVGGECGWRHIVDVMITRHHSQFAAGAARHVCRSRSGPVSMSVLVCSGSWTCLLLVAMENSMHALKWRPHFMLFHHCHSLSRLLAALLVQATRASSVHLKRADKAAETDKASVSE